MDEQAVVKLELTVAEVNTVLRVLAKHPFEEVFMLIQKMKNQGEAQLQELQATQPQQADEEVDTGE